MSIIKETVKESKIVGEESIDMPDYAQIRGVATQEKKTIGVGNQIRQGEKEILELIQRDNSLFVKDK